MVAVPLALPELSRGAADRLNRIAQWRMPLPLPGNETYALHRLDRPDDEPGRAAERLLITMTIGMDRLQATMPRPLLLDLLRSLDNALRFDPLPPPDLMALLLEAALLPLLEVLERAAGQRVIVQTVAAFGRDASSSAGTLDAARPAMQILVGIRGPGLRQTLMVEAMTDEVERLLRPWPGGTRPMHALPIPVSLVAGASVLTLRLIRSLRAGDVVLIQDGAIGFAADGTPSVLHLTVADTLTAIARIAGTRWRLDAPPRPARRTGQTMSETAASDPGDDMPLAGDLDEIPIRLVFEAARLELPLGSLRQLGAGSVLDIDAVPGTVRIMVNGRRIGDGELVSIDGRAGVRITAFAPDIDGRPAS